MPSSSLVEVKLEVGVEVEAEVWVKVEVEATFATFTSGWAAGWVGWCGEVKTRANLSQVWLKLRLSLATTNTSIRNRRLKPNLNQDALIINEDSLIL